MPRDAVSRTANVERTGIQGSFCVYDAFFVRAHAIIAGMDAPSESHILLETVRNFLNIFFKSVAKII